MWLRITDTDASVHKFLNFEKITSVDIDPLEGVRVWDGSESLFYTGKEGERISEAIEFIAFNDPLRALSQCNSQQKSWQPMTVHGDTGDVC